RPWSGISWGRSPTLLRLVRGSPSTTPTSLIVAHTGPWNRIDTSCGSNPGTSLPTTSRAKVGASSDSTACRRPRPPPDRTIRESSRGARSRTGSQATSEPPTNTQLMPRSVQRDLPRLALPAAWRPGAHRHAHYPEEVLPARTVPGELGHPAPH